MTARSLVIAVVFVSLALAATPVATVSTSGSFKLNGTPVPNAGVSEWPVSAGDEIATSAEPALILFQDGTRVIVNRNTHVRLHKDGSAGVDVLAGAASYKALSASKVHMSALGRPVNLGALAAGVVSIQGARAVVKAAGRDDNFGLGKRDKKPKPRSGHDNDDKGGRGH